MQSGKEAQGARVGRARRIFIPFGVRRAAHRGIQIAIATLVVSLAAAMMLMIAAD